MQISIALPNTVPGASGAKITDWAIRSEQRGFSSLVATERLVYGGYEPLTALAAAADVTTRIKLVTDILIAPLRSPALLAKEAASVAQLSGGRLQLGLAPGVREDDFVAAGQSFRGRGARFDQMLESMTDAWAGKPFPGVDGQVAALPAGIEIPLLFGGLSQATFDRVARWNAGWLAPGLTPGEEIAAAKDVCRTWSAAGRPGRPRLVMLLRFALGADAWEASQDYVRDYFAVLGPRDAEAFAQGTPHDSATITDAIRQFTEFGADELIFNPTVAEPSQVDRLADLVFSS
jgi:alkanesulfonate monooxygenase SsuD/methylene tetrahydromethanopterin reductase-like flavin-dependent oxidoreductase (luciferase family)